MAHDVWGTPLAAVAPETDGFVPNINVVRHQQSEGSTFESLIADHVGSLPRLLTDLQVIDRTDVTLGESAALRLVLAYRQGIFEVTQLQWLTDTPAIAFVISAACETATFDRWAPVFEHVAQSFLPT